MDILITIAFLALYYILGLGTVITLKNRNRRGRKTRRSRLPSGWRVSDTAICGVFGLDCAKDSEVER